jgi:hypothetical protein
MAFFEDIAGLFGGFGDFLGNIGSAVGGAAEGVGSAIGSIPGAVSDFGSAVYDMMGSGGQAAGSMGGFIDPQALSGPVSDFTPNVPLPAGYGFPDFPAFDPLDGQANVFQVANVPGAQPGTNPIAQIFGQPGNVPGMPPGVMLPFAGGSPPVVPPPTDPSLFKQATGFVGDNYKWMLPALGIGYSALQSNKPVPGQEQMQAYAQRMGQIGNQLTDPLMTGQLPPGYQSAFDRMQQSAEAAIKSKYAKQGISGSSMERSELANVPQQIETQKLQFAQTLATQGMQAMGLGGTAYNNIAQHTIAQDKMLSDALARFGAAAIQSK